MRRLIAIGDIHGFSAALDAVLGEIAPTGDDLIVTLGDYIDRGPDSRGVIDRLLAIREHTELVSILGNHDEMLLAILDGRHYMLDDWLAFGGRATLDSYETADLADIPDEHVYSGGDLTVATEFGVESNKSPKTRSPFSESRSSRRFVERPVRGIWQHGTSPPRSHTGVQRSRTESPDDQQRFRSMVTHMDAKIGQIVETLGQMGIREDTLLVFTSDNGVA